MRVQPTLGFGLVGWYEAGLQPTPSNIWSAACPRSQLRPHQIYEINTAATDHSGESAVDSSSQISLPLSPQSPLRPRGTTLSTNRPERYYPLDQQVGGRLAAVRLVGYVEARRVCATHSDVGRSENSLRKFSKRCSSRQPFRSQVFHLPTPLRRPVHNEESSSTTLP